MFASLRALGPPIGYLTYGGDSPGRALSKQRRSHWIVDCIALAYSQAGEELPRVRAHSTRSTATSVACLRGVTVEEICQGVRLMFSYLIT